MKLKQDKVMPRTKNDVLISYYQWIHIEKTEIRVIGGEEHHLNAGNLTDCDHRLISNDVTDELITTDVNSGDFTDFAEDATSGYIASIDSVVSMN